MSTPAPERLPARLERALRHAVGTAKLHRWPWPRWKLAGGTATLPIGDHSFVFRNVDRPELLWWAQTAHRGEWEQPMIDELSRALSTGDVFFDVGAFVGAYSLLASRIVGPGGRVIAFEPDPRARVALQQNLDANHAANVTVVPIALGDHDGTVRFFGGGDSVGHVGDGGELEVEMTTLDAYCEREGVEPDVMKMDIEGGEGAALSGSVVAGRIRELVVEIHEPELRARSIDPQALLAKLGPHRLIDPPESGNYAVVVTAND